jgi:hypothetical protein
LAYCPVSYLLCFSNHFEYFTCGEQT